MIKHLQLSVVINTDACLGDGVCTQHAPTTFALNERGISTLCADSIDCAEQIEAAVRHCPAQAIVLRTP